MARKIYLFWADKRANIETPGQPGVCLDFEQWPKHQAINAGIINSGAQGVQSNFCYFKDDNSGDYDKLLRVYTTPQLLFAFGHPEHPEPTDNGGAFSFVAKLTGGQITADNVALMISVIRKLDWKKRGADIEWYNPEMGFGLIGVSNVDGAPGSGLMIGLNPFNKEIKLEGDGFEWDLFFQNLKKILPWAIGAGLLYAAASNEKD